jgi:hypothetical protein
VPSLETLEAVTLLFPALRKLTINIFPPTDAFVSRSTVHDTSEDTRCPVLCDDDAFDNFPAEDVSDAEDEPASHVVLVTPIHLTKNELRSPGGDFSVRATYCFFCTADFVPGAGHRRMDHVCLYFATGHPRGSALPGGG